MKRFIAILFTAIIALNASAQHLGSEYKLKKVIEVKGRQGIAIDKDYYYVTPKKIILPDSVKQIDGCAFRYQYGLREINLRADMDISATAFDKSGYEESFKAFLAAKGEKK